MINMIIFIALNIVNVILGTVKTLCTIKGTKIQAALTNAVAFGFNTLVINQISNNPLDIFVKCLITAGCNFLGVYIVKYIEDKRRPERL